MRSSTPEKSPKSRQDNSQLELDLGVIPPEESVIFQLPEGTSKKNREILAGLQPESRNFLGKIFEKIKYSEFIQNIADRCMIWRNKSLVGRAENKIAKLNRKKEDTDRRAETAKKTAEKTNSLLAELELISLGLRGNNLNQEVVAKTREEIDRLNKQEEEAMRESQAIETNIQTLKTKQRNYQERVNETVERLDSRLRTKQEINNKTISEIGSRISALNESIQRNQKRIELVNMAIEDLSKLLEESKSVTGEVRHLLKGEARGLLREANRRRRTLGKMISKLKSERTKEEKRIIELEAKNRDLQGKRERIFASKGKAEESVEPETQERIVADKVEVAWETNKEKKKKEKEKFTADEIVAAWDNSLSKEGKIDWQLKELFKKHPNPPQEHLDEKAAFDFLLKLLAQKLTGGDTEKLKNTQTSRRVAHFIETFFAQEK